MVVEVGCGREGVLGRCWAGVLVHERNMEETGGAREIKKQESHMLKSSVRSVPPLGLCFQNQGSRLERGWGKKKEKSPKPEHTNI